MRRSDPGEEGLGVGGFEVAKSEVQTRKFSMRNSDYWDRGVEWFDVTKFENHKNLLSSLEEGSTLGMCGEGGGGGSCWLEVTKSEVHKQKEFSMRNLILQKKWFVVAISEVHTKCLHEKV